MKQTKGTRPYITRPHHRVITVWTTNIYLPDTTKSAEKSLVATWDFGRYKPFLDSNSTHIPSVIEVHELETAQLRFDADELIGAPPVAKTI